MGCATSRSSSLSNLENTRQNSAPSHHGEILVPKPRTKNGIQNNRVAGNGSLKRKNKSNLADDFTREEEIGDEFVCSTSKETVEEILKSLNPGELFCDPDFPASERVLLRCEKDDKKVRWLRPKEILDEDEEPEMMVDGVTRDDIKQGILGDCWFLSSCAALSQQDRFMKKILPKDQPLSGPSYRGVVCFRFWRFGEWVDVYIDDRLPTVDRKLIYAHCTEPREFWVALIEKAYAKIHGSYDAIAGGQTMDALVDLTGGLAERYELNDYDPNMYRLIMRSFKAGAFIACSKKGDWRIGNMADANGLVSGHAYTVTDIRKIKHQMGEEKLLRIRNPWGDATEWRGSWSDNDVNWKWVDDGTKQQMGIESKDDGEFWMSYKDFCCHFQEVTICLTGPDFDGDGVSDNVGHVEMVKGEWVADVSAGGSRNDLQMFSTNPQYVLTLTEPDDFNPQTDDAESEGKCSIVISLMQEHRKLQRNVKIKSLQIGFMLYKTDNPNDRLPAKFFRYNPDCGKSGIYINYREVSGRFELDPGHYVIIPSTFMAGSSAAFMLRVFGEKHFSLQGPLELEKLELSDHQLHRSS